jgi:hypothetical protein
VRCYISSLSEPQISFAALLTNIKTTLERCGRGINLVRDMEETLYEEGLITMSESERGGEGGGATAGYRGIVQLESSILDLGSSPSVCQGLFYVCPVVFGDYMALRFA